MRPFGLTQCSAHFQIFLIMFGTGGVFHSSRSKRPKQTTGLCRRILRLPYLAYRLARHNRDSNSIARPASTLSRRLRSEKCLSQTIRGQAGRIVYHLCIVLPTSTKSPHMSLRVISAKDVAQITATFSPQELADLMAQVFHSLSTSEKASNGSVVGIHQPHRISVPVTNHTALFMPSRIEPFGTAIKVVSVPTAAAPQHIKAAGLPGTTLVLDESSGAARAVVNARQLTALRNAAGKCFASWSITS